MHNFFSEAFKNQFFKYYTSASVFLLFFLSLILPSGYSIGAGLLFIPTLYFIWKKENWKNLNKAHYLLIFSFCFFAFTWFLEVFINNLGVRGLDRPSRFILASLTLVYLVKHKPKQSFIWAGIATGAWATGLWAILEKLSTNSQRVDAHTNAIQYGNISMLLGLLCLAGLIWAYQREKHRSIWIFLCLSGFIFALTASILSGSRGGWVGMPLIILYILHYYRNNIPSHYIGAGLAFLILSIIIAYKTPNTNLENRVSEAISDLRDYKKAKTYTSIGTRLELWRASILLIQERPLFGWGQKKYLQELKKLKDTNIVSPAIVSHSHNEILNAGVRRGFLGIFSLLLLYIIPLIIFQNASSKLTGKNTALPLAGIITIIAYFDFGLTQVFLAHNNGVVIYTFLLIVFLSKSIRH